MSDYDDIIKLNRPKSKFPQMSISDRASQFAPFQALNGFSDNIKESERIVDKKIELDDNQKELLDQKLNFILNNKNNLNVTITYFIPDLKKIGGSYVKIKGIIIKVNLIDGFLVLSNKEKIYLQDILSLEI